MNNNPCIIFAVEGNRLLVDIRRVADNTCSPPNESLYEPCHLSGFVCDFRMFSPSLPGAPKVLSGAPMCSQTSHNHSHGTPLLVIRDLSYFCTSHQRSQLLLDQSSEIPFTLKAGRNALPGSDTVLKLTHLSLHATSSQTLLVSSRDQNTFGCCKRRGEKMTSSINTYDQRDVRKGERQATMIHRCRIIRQ